MQADPDSQVGTIFRRLYLMQALGEPAFEKAVHAVLTALGKAALEEAEDRARALALPGGRRPGDVTVVPFAQRRPPEAVDTND